MRIVHRSTKGQHLGFDEIHDDFVEHYDDKGRYMGTSSLHSSAISETTEVIGSAGLGVLVAAYSANFIYSDPAISQLYETLRDIQAKCFSDGNVDACRHLKFLNGQLETLLRSKAS